MGKFTRWFLVFLAAIFLLSLTSGCGKIRASRHLKRAEKYFASGEYSKAEVEYLISLQSSPTNAQIIGRLANIYYEEGRLNRAYPFLTKACELSPGDLDLRLKLATIQLAAGKGKEARAAALSVLDKLPRHPEAPLLLADTVQNTNDFEQVRLRLEKLSAESGDSAAIQTALATLLLRKGEITNAGVAFQRAVTLDPNFAAAQYGLGTVCWAENDLKGADTALKMAAELSPVRSARRIKYAEFKLRTADLPEGKRLLAEISKAAPDYLPAWLRQAEVALSQQDHTNCATFVNRVLVQDAGNYEALILHGRLMLAQRDAGKAVAEFDKMAANEMYGRSPQVHFYAALAHLLNNDSTKALNQLSQAVSLDPNYDDAILLEAELNIGRGESSPAISALNTLLKRQPRLPLAHLELASAYQLKGELESALAVYRRLGEIYPKNPETPMRMGLVYLQQNKKTEARAAFTRTLELATNYLPAVERLVDLDLAERQYDAALARAEAESEKNPKAFGPHLLQAKVHMTQAGAFVKLQMDKEKSKMGSEAQLVSWLARVPEAQKQVELAEAELVKAIELNATSQESYLLLARLYVDMGKKQKALEKLNEDLVKNPKDLKALMLVASIQDEAKDYSAARAAYEKLIAANLDFAPALNNLANLYSEHFDMLDKAYEMANRARDLLAYKPQGGDDSVRSVSRTASELLRAYPTDTLGWVAYKKGQYPWALSLFRESSAKLANNPEIQYHLGMTYYMLGKKKNAQTALEQALALNQDFAAKDEVNRRLGILKLNPKNVEPNALTELEKELKSQPDDPIVLERVSGIYERNGKLEKILPLYEAALAFEDSQKGRPHNVPILVGLARLYSEKPNTQAKGMELAKEAYKLAPDDSEVLCELGKLVSASGDHKWALSLLQQGTARDEAEPDNLYDLGLAYFSVGRIADAHSSIGKALQNSETFSRAAAAKELLELLPSIADPAKASASEAKAAERLKTNPSDLAGLMISAYSAAKRGETTAARQGFEKVMKASPDFSPASRELALLYTDIEDGRAYQMSAKAREAFPDDPEIARALGINNYRRSDFNSAVRFLNETVRKAGEDGQTMYYLGMAHFQLKNTRECKQALQRALALKIDEKLAEDAKRVLSKLG